MARTSKKNNEQINCDNVVRVSGKIKKILVDTDKVCVFILDITNKTPNGNYTHCWLKCVDFDLNENYKEGYFVAIEGQLTTNKYEDKKNNTIFETRLVVKEIDVLEEIPFN